MTGQLRTTMQHHTETLMPVDLDLDAIVASGRRRTQRRTALVGGIAVAAVVAVGAVAAGTGRLGSDSTASEFAGIGGTSFSYAVGSVLHSGSTTTDLGVDISAYVPTRTGVVFADPRGWVYVVDGSAPRAIGHLGDHASLVADDGGTTVAWVGRSDLEIYRVGLQDPLAVPLQVPLHGESPSVRAVSDGVVWFWDARGTSSYDVASQQLDSVAGLDNEQSVQSVAGDRLLAEIDGATGTGGMSVLHLPLAGSPAAPPQVANIYSGTLAPDGQHWFTEDGDQFAVFDSTTGERQDPPYPGFAFAAPYMWLDDDTIAVLALPRVSHAATAPISLLTCHVSSNACTVTAADIGTGAQVAIPVGRSLGG